MRAPTLLRLAGALSLVGTLMAAATGVGNQPAGAATALIGWTAQADGNPVDIVVDNAAGLGGVHPLSEADLPEDTSDFESGPFGHALASVLWPGAAAGNLGSLSGELPLPTQLAPLFAKTNDPVRAESFFPAGPAAATYPPGSPGGAAEMEAHADKTGVSTKAAVTDASVPRLFDLKAVHGSSSATAMSRASSAASSSFGGLSLLGGLLQIGASSSSASAASDGVHLSGNATTHLGAITVAGHAASVGTDGLVIGPPLPGPVGLTALPTALVNQLVAALDLKVVPLPRAETRHAPAEKITSAGLQISFAAPPSVGSSINCSTLPQQLNTVCTLPGLLQGATMTLTIGRVSATAIAALPFAPSAAQGPGLGAPPASVGDSALPLPPAAGAEQFAGTSFGSASGSGATSGGGAGLAPSLPAASPLGLRPASLSRPVRAGLVVFIELLAAAIGLALLALAGSLKRPPPGICSLEERS